MYDADVCSNVSCSLGIGLDELGWGIVIVIVFVRKFGCRLICLCDMSFGENQRKSFQQTEVVLKNKYNAMMMIVFTQQSAPDLITSF